MAPDLAFVSAVRLARMIAARDLSPVEAVRALLDRIERLNPKLNAYLTVCADEALAAARAAEDALMREVPTGLLHGVPLSLKDLTATKGIRTTMGSLLFQDNVPAQDAIVVERVKQAGAIILGKTNTPEFAAWSTTENRLGDPCNNPWDVSRTVGGSSGGAAAAVAAGLGPVALGGDMAGSIRNPAAFCGVFGYKPSRGLVPMASGPRPVFSAFGQQGPLSRTVEDSALLLRVIAGYDRRYNISLRERPPNYQAGLQARIDGLTMAWSPDLGYAAVDPEVAGIAEEAARAFEGLGAEIELPTFSFDDPWDIYEPIGISALFSMYETVLETKGDLLTDYVKDRVSAGKSVTGADYALAMGQLEAFTARMDDWFERYHVLLTPTLATTAFPHGQFPEEIGGRTMEHPWRGFTPFTYPFNLAGNPAATVPCGFTSEGLPVGLQIVGARGADALVLQVSAAFEQARPWAAARPNLD